MKLYQVWVINQGTKTFYGINDAWKYATSKLYYSGEKDEAIQKLLHGQSVSWTYGFNEAKITPV